MYLLVLLAKAVQQGQRVPHLSLQLGRHGQLPLQLGLVQMELYRYCLSTVPGTARTVQVQYLVHQEGTICRYSTWYSMNC